MPTNLTVLLHTGETLEVIYQPMTGIFHGPRGTSYGRSSIKKILKGSLD